MRGLISTGNPLLISPNVSRQAAPGGHGVLRAAGHAAPHLSLHQTEERAHQPRQRGEQPAARRAAPEQRHLQEEVLQARAPPRLPPRDGQEGQDNAQQQAAVLLEGWFRSYTHPPQEYIIIPTQELFCWRDKLARAEDESVQYVLPNHMMLKVGTELPREMQGVLACCNPVPPLVRQHLVTIHQVVLAAR